MKKNIVVATDFSQRSFEVIDQALAFAKAHDKVVHVVHIIENNFLDTLKEKTIETIHENSFAHIKEKIPSLLEENFHCREGSLKEEIENYVKELQAYMVIVGSSGERSSILEDFLGTSTKSIVRSIDVPCLVLKSQRENLDFESILLPTDLSKTSKKHIDTIHTLFPYSKIELVYSYLVPFEKRLSFYGIDRTEAIVYQKDTEYAAVTNSREFYDSLDVDKKKVKISIIKDGLNPDAFSAYADKKKSDLIAIHTTGFFSFFAFDLLEHSHKDVLITRM